MRGHGKRADRGDQRHQALEPYRLFRGGVAFMAEPLVGEDFLRRGKALAAFAMERGTQRTADAFCR